MILRIALSVASSLTFLFFFWRKLKEDYIQNQIFSVGFYSLFGIIIFSAIGIYFIPEYSFWLALLGSLLGLTLGIKKFRFRFFETVEAWSLGALGILLGLYLYEFIYRFQFIYAIISLFLIFIIFLFLMLDKHYKKFTWYKSGKVGFSGLMILGLFFLARCLIALFIPDMLFFVGRVDVIISGVMAFISFLMLFNLSRE